MDCIDTSKTKQKGAIKAKNLVSFHIIERRKHKSGYANLLPLLQANVYACNHHNGALFLGFVKDEGLCAQMPGSLAFCPFLQSSGALAVYKDQTKTTPSTNRWCMVRWLTSLVPSCLARKGNPLGSVLLSVCFFFVACLFLCFLSLGFCSLPSKSPNRRPTFEVPPELSVLQQLSGRYELMGILPDIIWRQNKLPTSAKARHRVQIPTQYSRIQQRLLQPGFSGASKP